ncbi:MAG: hypothetical protein HY722_10190 [Planctomycetes bacterium]|nr:hypothetical protein [Planctomycetota bacterium]
MRGEPPGGFSLIELLVAMTVFIILGGILAAVLGGSIRSWQAGEAVVELNERARLLLDSIQDDLSATRTSPAGTAPVRFLGDYDALGRQRLRLVRTTTREAADPLLRQAGSALGANAAYDGAGDLDEAAGFRLLPTGGLMEVAYLVDPQAGSMEVRRGVRAPVGGAGSLLDDATLADLAAMRDRAPVVAEGVLLLELNYWAPATDEWDAPYLVAEDLRAPGDQARGPCADWDSTRGLAAGFAYHAGPGSVADPSDDLYPTRVEVVVVLAPGGPGAPSTRLLEAASDADPRLRVESTVGLPVEESERYVKVDEEWIRYRGVTEREVVVEEGGRGVRGTQAVGHAAGATVRAGRSFSLVVRLP